MEKFQNKYRIPSARLQNWDYGSNGSYFITICTADMQYHFGEVHDREMHLSESGMLAYMYWSQIPEKFPFVALGEFVVMPNHMHGIIIIDGNIVDRDGGGSDGAGGGDNDGNGGGCDDGSGGGDNDGNGGGCDDGNGGGCSFGGFGGGRDAINRVSTTNPPKQHQPGGITGDKNPMLYDNLSRAIRWYKGRVAFEIHKINAGFAWQSRFHDHIIRDDKSFERITNYIKNNPAKWSDDKFKNA